MATYRVYIKTGENYGRTIPVAGASAPSLPAWISAAVGVGSVGVSVLEPPTAGEYSYDFSTFTLVVTVLSAYTTSQSVCCSPQTNIAYLNRQGGWENYILDGDTSYTGSFTGDEALVVDGYTLKRTDMGRAYDGERSATRRINTTQVGYLWRLRHSIVHWLYSSGTTSWSVEIVIDRQDMEKRRRKQKVITGTVSWRYAKELTIQRR